MAVVRALTRAQAIRRTGPLPLSRQMMRRERRTPAARGRRRPASRGIAAASERSTPEANRRQRNVSGAVAATDRPAVGVVAAAGDDGVQASRADSGEPSGESLIARAGREGSDGDRASADESSGDQANGPAAAEPSDDAARAAHAGGSRPSQASFARDRGSERAIDAGSESSPANVSGEPSGDHLAGEFSIATAERERSGDDLEDSGESWRDERDGPAAAAGRAPDAGSEIFSTRAVAVDGAAQESAYAESRRAAVSEGDSDWSESPSGAEGGVDESSSETAGEASGVAPSAPAEPLSSAVRADAAGADAAGADDRSAPSDIEAAQKAPAGDFARHAIGLALDRKGASRVGSGPLIAPPQSDRASSGRRSSARHAHDRAASARRSPARPHASPQRHVGQGAADAASAKDAAPGPGPSGAVLVSSTLAVVGALLLSRRRTRVLHSILYTSRIERPG